MLCPCCRSGDTRVIDSRPENEGAAIRRRRMCEAVGCGHRFTTWETTANVVAKRRKEAERSARRREADPEYFRARNRIRDAVRNKPRHLVAQAKAEAAETGEPLAKILARWGLSSSALPRSEEGSRG